jgi:hypothetical protein
MKKPYLPRSESELVQWLANFSNKLPTHGSLLSLTAAEISAAQDDCNLLRYLIADVLPQRRTELQELTNYKDLIKDGPLGTPNTPLPSMAPLPPAPPVVAPGVIPRLRALVQRIKNHPNYTTAIGEDLGVEGAETLQPIGTPTFKAIALPNHQVKLEWKKGNSDGVYIESQRGSETTWNLLAVDRFSPYIDTRPPLVAGQVETRRYRMRYLEEDTPASPWSDIVTISTIE